MLIQVVYWILGLAAVYVIFRTMYMAVVYDSRSHQYVEALNQAKNDNREYEFKRYLLTEPVIGVYVFVVSAFVLVIHNGYPELTVLWAVVAGMCLISIRFARMLLEKLVDKSMRTHGGKEEWLTRKHIKSAEFGTLTVLYKNRKAIKDRIVKTIAELREEEEKWMK